MVKIVGAASAGMWVRIETSPLNFCYLLNRQSAVQILTDYIRILDRPACPMVVHDRSNASAIRGFAVPTALRNRFLPVCSSKSPNPEDPKCYRGYANSVPGVSRRDIPGNRIN